MIRHIKTAKASIEQGGADSAVTRAVEGLLAQVRDGGDKAVRALSVQFDNFDRDSYRLTKTGNRGLHQRAHDTGAGRP